MDGNEIKYARESIDESTFEASIWTREDIKTFLENNEEPATKANIDAILTPRFRKDFGDRLNELGYELLAALIDIDGLPDKAE